MARPRAFDRDQVLQHAIRVFCDKGFAAASTEELMQAMGLSRQSMYTPLATNASCTCRPWPSISARASTT